MSDLDALRYDNEPLARALAMARSLAQFLADLGEDEPTDDDERVLPLVACASRHADALVSALTAVVGATTATEE